MSTNINVFGIDCAALACNVSLGAASAQQQFCAENINQSELNSLILVHPTLGPLVTNWGGSLSPGDFDILNTNVDNTKQKRFFGIGDVPANESTKVTLNDFQSHVLNRTFTLNFTITDISPETYDYFRRIQCDKTKPLLYYTTTGGFIYGGANAITPLSFDVKTPLDRGEESLEKIELEIMWKALTSPDRFPMPIL